MNETVQSIINDLRLENVNTAQLEKIGNADHRYIKDLRLNIKAVLKDKNLSKKELYLVALSIASNERNQSLIDGFEKLAKEEDATDAEIAEVHACTSLMNANNIIYRFRHYMPENEFYSSSPLGLRMNIMMNPILGKELFELISFAVSAVNNCEMCIKSHEQSVKQQGASEAKVYDAVRLAAIVKSLSVLI